jgi:hypothetical protein
MIKIRITPALFADLRVRVPDEDGAWRGIEAPGIYHVTEQQARQIAGDCDYQGNITGDWIDTVGGGVTRAYRSLYANIQRDLAAGTGVLE